MNATISGAGSTLAAPIYETWASALKSGQALTVNYNGTGSGAGVSSLQGKTVAFAGSDPALKPKDVKGFKGKKTFQFPVAAGAITVSYNVPGVKTGLKLTGPVIADIFDGTVTKWNSPEIKSLNPGVKLPSTAIHTVYRSDSSGTTNGFTTFLSATSPTFKSKVGAGKSVKFPVGSGASGNPGVATAVSQTPGSVGYVEQAYALQHKFTYASVKNAAGKWVAPTIPASSAAFTGIKVPSNLGLSTINSKTASAYPIVSQTFLDTYQDPCKDGGLNQTKAKGLKAFLTYAFGAGQKTFGTGQGQLPYASLPAAIASKDNAQLAKLTCNGKPIK
ncbi:MAG: phosphate ABC transporter substrate-binding protein PstS [Solirubrobacterales bacterium]|nr:phosphate ABC transporter substrate-binding protein PstS [Solirubrobacterales bacterium]